MKIISGGQTGADQAGLRAAKRFGLETGGWMPKGWLTEDGPRPEFESLYGMRKHESASYRDRTIANIRTAETTLLFGDPRTPGGKLAMSILADVRLPYTVIGSPGYASPETIARCVIERNNFKTINIAGNRESKAPGIGAWVEAYLCDIFLALGYREGDAS